MKNRKALKIGIVGCGAIGSSLAHAIKNDFSGFAVLNALYDLKSEKAGSLSDQIKKGTGLSVGSLKQLIARVDLVIECAHARYSAEIARLALQRGRDVMVMSVGGIMDDFQSLYKLAESRKASMYIPSGALGGIDAVKALNLAGIKKAVLTTTKHPLSFKGVAYVEEKNIDVEKIKADTVLFCGSAQKAVRNFPQNVNVAAVLSLAGVGGVKTQVRIVASLKAKRNMHEIQIESKAGSFYSRTENCLHPGNPKTSYLAFLSAVSMLKQILEPVTIGT